MKSALFFTINLVLCLGLASGQIIQTVLLPDRGLRPEDGQPGGLLVEDAGRVAYGQKVPESNQRRAVHLALLENGRWRHEATLDQDFALPEYYAGFGDALALHGSCLAVGTTADGPVFIYQRSASGWPDSPTIIIPSLVEPGEFTDGGPPTLSMHGSLLAVGIRLLTNPENSRGRVALFLLENGQARPIQVLESPHRELNNRFGAALKLHGNRLAVSDPAPRPQHAPLEAALRCELFIYDFSGGGFSLAATIRSPHITAQQKFGEHVELKNNLLLVSQSDSNESTIHTYEFRGNKWSKSAQDLIFPQDFGLQVPADNILGMQLSQNMLLVNLVGRAPMLHLRSAGRWRLTNPNLTDARLYPNPAFIAAGYVLRDDADLHFEAINRMIIWNGPVSTDATFPLVDSVVAGRPNPLSPSEGALSLGQFMAGSVSTATLTLQNCSIQELRLDKLKIETGQSYHDIIAADIEKSLLAPGATTRVRLSFLAEPGYNRLTIRVPHRGSIPDEGLFSVVYQGSGQPDETYVQFYRSTFACRLGTDFALVPELTGNRAFSCRWLKNGRVMSGESRPYLSFKELAVSDAAAYTLEIRHPGTATVQRHVVNLLVYAPPATTLLVFNANEPARFKVSVWGPTTGVTMRWTGPFGWSQPEWYLPRAGSLVENQEGNTADIHFIVYDGDSLIADIQFEARIRNEPRVTSVPISHYAIVGEPFEARVILSDNSSDLVVETRGLPPGILYNSESNSLIGTPEQTGSYDLIIKVKSQNGREWPPITHKLYITSSYNETDSKRIAYRSYSGYYIVYESTANTPFNYCMVSLQLTKNFRYTLKIYNTHKTFTHAGAFKLDGEYYKTHFIINNFSNSIYDFQEQLVIQIPKNSTNLAKIELKNEFSTFYLNASLNERGGLHQYVRGRKNVSLTYNELQIRSIGRGYGSFSVTKNYNAIGTLTLPNGYGLTFSQPLQLDSSDSINTISETPTFQIGSSYKDSTSFILRAFWVYTQPDQAVGGLVLYVPQQYSYRTNFPESTYYNLESVNYEPQLLSAFQGATGISCNLDINNHVFDLAHDGIQDLTDNNGILRLPVRLQNNRFAVIGSNPGRLNINIHRPTGFFSGHFTLPLIDRLTLLPIQRRFHMKGMLLPGLQAAYGSFDDLIFSPTDNDPNRRIQARMNVEILLPED